MNRTRTSKNAKRLLVWLLLLTMVFGLLPMAAFADEAGEPVVIEEPVQEPEPSSEPTEAPSEPTQEPTQEPEPEQPGNAVVTIESDEELEEAAITNNTVELKNEWLKPSSSGSYKGEFMKIFFLDCGRKYFSVDNIKALIDNASAAGFNYIQLAVGNDGLRFLLDDMSLTVNGTTYSTEQVSNAIKTGNEKYYNFDVNELTQSQMDTIIAYAKEKKMGVIPCVNTPGHMDAILSAASSLTGTDCSYSGSVRTIDVTNATAVAFTQALLQKYIVYFAGKDCKFFNMGADEYANDKFTGGSMGFGNLQSEGNYSYYVQYVNQVAAYIKNAGMTPMAFNDGIYFNNNTWSGDFDTDILICYWSSGWDGYSPMPASTLKSKGFSLVNTHGDYYWVLGKSDAQCSPAKAAGFDETVFPGSTINEPSGAMFCIWCDYPGKDTAENVVNKTAATIDAFGKALPNPPTTGGGEPGGGSTGGETQEPVPVNLTVGETSDHYYQDGDYSSVKNTDDDTIATVVTSVGDKPGKTTYESTKIGEGTFWISTSPSTTTAPPVKLTFESVGNNECYVKNANGQYIYPYCSYDYWNGKSANIKYTENPQHVLTVKSSEAGYYDFSYSDYYDYYYDYYTAYLTYENGSIGAATSSGDNTHLYLLKEKTTSAGKQTTITFTGVKPGTTTCQIGNTLYEIIVDYKQETVNAFVGGKKTVEGVSGELDTTELNTDVATVTLAGNSLAITGVGEGTTSVIVGDTKYTIVVTKEDLKKVTPLPLEYWITNGQISSVNGVTSETRTNLKNETYEVYFTNILATVDSIASAEGINVLKNIAPDTTEYENRDVYYWHCRMLDTTKANSSSSGTERQTNDGGDDDTSSGVGFTKIRYYNGAWAVYTENFEWVAVESKHQLVAYYREYIKVSDEIESYAADWGNRGDGTPGGWLDTSSYCTLSMQVVYEDNTTNPISTSAAALKSKTIVYGYWSNEGGRGIGTVMLDGKEYEIYKVTSETGAATVSFSGYNATVANFTWDNNETTVWEGDATDSVTIHNPSKGYSTDGANANLCWDENKEAILLRVYIRAKVTEDSLTVHYVETQNNQDFYSYNIAVAQNTVFDAGFAKQGDGLVNNTVVNIKGQTQTVKSNLSEMQEVGAQYKYANYTFDKAERSQDGKEVFLYYSFTRNKSFVVDFGLPLEIKPTDLSDTLASANIEKTVAESTSFAKITVNNPNIKYELIKTLDQNDIFSVNYSGTNLQTSSPDGINFTIEVIPATSVYYEDSFAKFANGKNTASGAKWEVVGKETTAYQALSELGKDPYAYGYDPAYNKENSATFSMGSAHKVTVTSGMLTDWNNDSAWPTASFTFKGTGFDIISLTDGDSGAILVEVKNKNDGSVKNYLVNNYYGYELKGDKWVVDKNSTDCLYQIPVIKVTGLSYDEYTVTIKVFYDKAFDMRLDENYSFWLDAIRVYDPMGKEANYTADNEGYPQYIKLRDYVANNIGSVNSNLLFIDGVEKAEVAAYANYGPNNEVYLAKGQAISFKLPGGVNFAEVQIGAKAPAGESGMTVNSETPTGIASATEMYYDITSQAKNGQVTITNTTGNILSLTNIKITFSKPNAGVSLAPLSDSDAEAAVATVRALFAAPVDPEPTEPEQPEEPEKTFEPEHFETSWSSNVRKGGRAVLTVKASTDVDAIVVNGVTVTQFKTRTERIGYGWNAKRVTYREFVYMMTVNESGTLTVPVVAVSNEQGESNPYETTLTVKPSSPIRDWIGGLFGRWF